MANHWKLKRSSEKIARRSIRAKKWSLGFHSNNSKKEQIITIINKWIEDGGPEECRGSKEDIIVPVDNRRSEEGAIRQEWGD